MIDCCSPGLWADLGIFICSYCSGGNWFWRGQRRPRRNLTPSPSGTRTADGTPDSNPPGGGFCTLLPDKSGAPVAAKRYLNCSFSDQVVVGVADNFDRGELADGE